MVKVDIKGLARRVEAFKTAAHNYSDASERVRIARTVSAKANRIGEEQEAYRDLEAAAIELVKVLATGDDGKGGWLSATFDTLKKKPYALVFANAEKKAARKPTHASESDDLGWCSKCNTLAGRLAERIAYGLVKHAIAEPLVVEWSKLGPKARAEQMTKLIEAIEELVITRPAL